jgi:hypothetical protein
MNDKTDVIAEILITSVLMSPGIFGVILIVMGEYNIILVAGTILSIGLWIWIIGSILVNRWIKNVQKRGSI